MFAFGMMLTRVSVMVFLSPFMPVSLAICLPFLVMMISSFGVALGREAEIAAFSGRAAWREGFSYHTRR